MNLSEGVGFLVNDTWANGILRYGHFNDFWLQNWFV